MKMTIRLTFILLIFSIISCGPSVEEKASTKLKYAQLLLEKNDTTGALIHLDSIPRLYPKAEYAVNAAKNIRKEVEFDLLHRKEVQLDSLSIKIAELEKPFQKEKTELDRFTQYIHKRQNISRAWNRSFIQVHLDERGEIYLSSNYHGKSWLNHIALRVYDQGLDARTVEIPVGDADNHRSDFMDYVWERVTYRNGKDNGVMEFIAENSGRNLKAVFLGKEYYYIVLESYDKQAVIDALALSKALKNKRQLEGEIQSLKKKLNIT